MNRLKNSGFYKVKFFITPGEFKSVLTLFEQHRAQFHHTNYARTQDDLNQVYEAYRTYYQYFTASEKPDYHPFFVYAISFVMGNENSGFFVRNEGVQFPYLGQWAEDVLPYVMLTLPKGVQINVEDEQGKYYIYEDIRGHQPLTYDFFDEIAKYTKKMTKPLRFSVHSKAAMEEQKPSVRISQDAMNDMSHSWIFKKYELVMNNK
ncbi:hypothetical protein ABES58_00780 [Paenibacillus lautus]|uniref:hypothetical protein n=1 Tax=Paenibacillus lautus TaxID=1401 RepID=UPI003D2D76C9